MDKDNKELVSFLVTKHSWRGKYKRVLSIGTQCLTTYNPSNMEETNHWHYSTIINVTPLTSKSTYNDITSGVNDMFNLVVLTKSRKGKTESFKFSSEFRVEILCSVLLHQHKFSDNRPKFDLHRYNCKKHSWSDKKIPVIIEVGVCSVNQIDPNTDKLITSYLYRDIDDLIHVNDNASFIICSSGIGRCHFFTCCNTSRDDVTKKICESAWLNCGYQIRVKKDTISFDHYQLHRFGRSSHDEAITSLFEFVVHKIPLRGDREPVKRILALTDSCLVERDPASYSLITLKPLTDIFALIRSPANPQLFQIEFVRGTISSYTSTDRDALLASLLDGVRSSGNMSIHVKMLPTNRAYRLGPYSVPVDEEVESWHLKFLHTTPSHWTFNEAVLRFNCNCAYSGLLHSVTQDGFFAENKEKLIQMALGAFVEKEGDQDNLSNEDLEQHFHALRRLVASKAGFAAFTLSNRFRDCLGLKIVKALKRNNDAVTHSAIDMLCSLMQPMHDDYDLRHEQLNKTSLLSSKEFLEDLLNVLHSHVNFGTGALVVASMLDFLTFALCAPYSETTDGGHFDTLLTMVASYGRPLFKLFQHPSLAIVKGAGLVMKAIIEEGDEEVARRMQALALAEGSLPRHLHISLFPPSSDRRYLAFQQLSRHLVALWIVENDTALQLLKRIFPVGLLNYLNSKEEPPRSSFGQIIERNNLKIAQEQMTRSKTTMDSIRDLHPSVRMIEKHVDNALKHWRQRIGLPKREDPRNNITPVLLRKRRERIKSTANWPMFYYQFYNDHSKLDLIWNFRTREELRDFLENEIRSFSTNIELSSKQVTIAWNHREFEVIYSSLSDEIRIGDYYLRLLLEEGENKGETFILNNQLVIKKPYEFFNDLYHKFLLPTKDSMKQCCLQAMSIIYGAYHKDIGEFHDIGWIVKMLDSTKSKLERDRLVRLISKLILNEMNVKQLIDSNGLKVLVDLATLAHLHVNRATVNAQTNVIEGTSEMMSSNESVNEWYFMKDNKEVGPVSFKKLKELYANKEINEQTKCWVDGLNGWKPLIQIAQLKWCLVAKNDGLMNESELSTLILNILISVCEYYPSRDEDGAIIRPIARVRRYLTDDSTLRNIVNLLLTFDTVLVERVSILLTILMQDNPVISRLYLTGVFYFILMYTGSNLIPISKLFHLSHMRQSFRIEDNNKHKVYQRSILRTLLPDAMVCYLENYGPEKFAQIFLAEFDTPEAIWSGEMRRLMIEKIACHIADFSPRLRSNVLAVYQYCPIPTVQYPQLENELFCNIYYLKNLCDTIRFPNWAIKNPLELLKDILLAWKEEVEKKPLQMSVDSAYDILELSNLKGTGTLEEGVIRKAYFNLAAKYHPDKNPDGREKFEEINKAYELLCSKDARFRAEGPDPINITLILRAQSILFSQCSDELHPYKYAGYPMLVKTLRIETKDESLFSKEYPLLAYACETAFHSVKCSSLNAEELRREGGLEVLNEAFGRCISVLSASSKPEDVAVQVCVHIVRCFTVSAGFLACRSRIIEMNTIVKDLNRILYFDHLKHLCLCTVDCISAFAADGTLRTQLYEAGILYSLLLFLFKYDYTLEEGGVETSDETNKQEVANQLAKMSVIACARMSGDLTEEELKNSKANPVIRDCLESMLTRYIARQMGVTNVAQLLKTLNSNIENPYLIWNNSTRNELIEYLERSQHEVIRGSLTDKSYGRDFKFNTYKDELVVGGLFVRVYNMVPTFPLVDAKTFTRDLLDWIGSQAQYLHSALSLSTSYLSQERLTQIESCLKALGSVIKHNPGVETQCIGSFKLLFSLLRLEIWPSIQLLAIKVILSVTGSKGCVEDIANSNVLVYLLLVLYKSCDHNKQGLVLDTLLPLVSNGNIAKEAHLKGSLLYLLNMFVHSSNSGLREKSAELIGRLMSAKLVGPKVRLILNKFLPIIFVDAIRDSSANAVNLFDNNQENPELIWNEHVRMNVKKIVRQMTDDLYKSQCENPSYNWKIDDDFEIIIDHSGEMMIAGVYLRLFVANPSWVIRRPKEFLTELMDAVQNMMNRKTIDESSLTLVVKALVNLLSAQPALLDLIPPMGYFDGLISQLNSKKHSLIPQSSLSILNQIANNKACVDSLVGCDGLLRSLMKCLSIDESHAIIGSEILSKIFSNKSKDDLVLEAIQVDLVGFLLKLLDRSFSNSTKAVIVGVLKVMCENITYGEQVSAKLDKSPVWSEFKDQKHDLFIENTQNAGYITGTANYAGYLTQGSNVRMSGQPPPMRDY